MAVQFQKGLVQPLKDQEPPRWEAFPGTASSDPTSVLPCDTLVDFLKGKAQLYVLHPCREKQGSEKYKI